MRVARVAVLILMVLLIGALIWQARDTLATVEWFEPRTLGAIGVMLLAWIAGQCAAGVAWWVLIGRIIALRAAVAVLLTTQIGKYLPGNVGQFVGRAYLGYRHGVPLVRAAASITAEGLLSIGLGLGTALAMLALDPSGAGALAEFLPGFGLLVAIVAVVVGALAGLLFFPQRIARLLPADSRLQAVVPPPLPPAALGQAVLLHGLLFTILGFGLWLVMPAFADQPVPLSVSIAVFGVATVAGFVTPGAPGGLGVREAVIVTGLAPYCGAEDATVIALALRAATMLGDVAIFAIGWMLLPAPLRAPPEAKAAARM